MNASSTLQIITAPIGALYVVDEDEVDYHVANAFRLGRGDLHVVGESMLPMIRSSDYRSVVVDHRAFIEYCNSSVTRQIGMLTAEARGRGGTRAC